MRTALRLLGTRYGIAAALVVIVLAVVSIGRLADTGSRVETGPPVAPVSPSMVPTADNVESGNDALVEPSDAAASPSLSAGAANVPVVAKRFVAAWLHHSGVTGTQWRDGMAPDATPNLMAKLKDTDPNNVPADTIAGGVTMIDEGGLVWAAAIPVNGGMVTLTLISMRGRWLVDGIDWQQT